MSRFLSVVLVALLAGLGIAAQSADAPAPATHPALPQGNSELCLTCHADLEEEMGRKLVHGPVADGECTSCHDPHVARFEHLLRRESNRLCQGCHTNLRDELRLPVVHGALKAGGDCVQCHSPHSSNHVGLLQESAVTLCTACHEHTAAQLALEHPHLPAAEGECTACHAPHAGTDLTLLAASPPALCVDCHAGGVDLDGAHRGFAVSASNCSNCHAPHGAAQVGLLRPLGHAPFDDGDCSACHTNPRKPAELTTAGTALCEDCHGDYGGSGETDGHHDSVPGSGCAACHSPHAGEAPAMMDGPQRFVCFACHTEIADKVTRGNSHHPWMPDTGSCSACHQPHGSGHESLLKQDENSLCIDCHTDHSRFAHPMGPNVPDPLRPGKSINCLSCHDPHASEYEMMLSGPPDRGLCVGCHGDLHAGG